MPHRTAWIAPALAALVLAAPAGAQVTLYTLEGESNFDFVGASVAACGDVNGDGAPDFVVGVPGVGKGGTARLHSGADGATLLTFTGVPTSFSTAGNDFGSAVACAGDVDGDGTPDVLVGSAQDDQWGVHAGAAWVFSGSDGSVLHGLFGPGESGARFGHSVAAAGDVDHDGHDDVLVGAPHHSPHGHAWRGSAWLYSGADGSVLLTLFGNANLDEFGTSVAVAGDTNGDGFPDLLIGSLAGYARLHSSRGGALLLSLVGSAQDSFASEVAAVGDVDGDGLPDLAVGAPWAGDVGEVTGAVHVLRGTDGALLHLLEGDATTQYLGAAIAGAGDVNGDGRADILVGAPGNLNGLGGPETGIARLYSGADGALAFTLTSGVQDHFGGAVSRLGDGNGDGQLDFLVGAPWAVMDGVAGGRVSVLSLLPPTLRSLTPESVQALDDGWVSVTGEDLDTVLSVQVSGVAGDADFNVLDDTTLEFLPPAPGALGPTTVTLVNLAGASGSLALDYVQTDPPQLIAPSVGESGAAFTWNYGAAPGAQAALLASLDGSTVAIGGLSVLAHGTVIDSGLLDAAGLGSTSIHMPAAALGLQFYAQLVTFDGGLSGATNVVWTWVLI